MHMLVTWYGHYMVLEAVYQQLCLVQAPLKLPLDIREASFIELYDFKATDKHLTRSDVFL